MTGLVYLGEETVEKRSLTDPVSAPDRALIRVSRAGICGTDLHIYLGHMDQRVTTPLVMGHEMVGEVLDAPSDSGVTAGDRVVVEPTVWCGRCPACRRGNMHICQNLDFLGIDSEGAFQNMWSVPADRIHKVPDNLTDDAGALIEPLAVAVHDVRRAPVEVADRAVVIGGGPIGLLVAMAARLDGAEVLVSEVNPFRIEQAIQLGFDTVNPKETDLSNRVQDWTDGAGADLVFEVSGSAPGAEVMTDLVRVRGTICMVGVHAERRSVDLHRFFWRELDLKGCRVYESVDFERAIRIAADGRIDPTVLVTKTVPFEEAEWGFEQMKTGGDVMKVLIDCQS